MWWNAPGDRSQPTRRLDRWRRRVKFARPEWQNVHVRSLNAGGIDGRVVPDVAALAGLPGYSLVFHGQPTMNGGTSAAAPLWAALVARIAAAGRPESRLSRAAPVRRGSRRACSRRKRLRRHHARETTASPQPGFGYEAQLRGSTRSAVGACRTGRRCSRRFAAVVSCAPQSVARPAAPRRARAPARRAAPSVPRSRRRAAVAPLSARPSSINTLARSVWARASQYGIAERG